MATDPSSQTTLEESAALSVEQQQTQKKSFSAEKKPPPYDFLDEYSKNKWESLLYYILVGDRGMDIVMSNLNQRIQKLEKKITKKAEQKQKNDPSSSQESQQNARKSAINSKIQKNKKLRILKSYEVSKAMKELLKEAGLTDPDSKGELLITRKGFQFLLQDTKSQIWTLLKHYIQNAHKRKLDTKDVLHFLFQLSFLTPGKGFTVEDLKPTQRIMLEDLANFGLIFQWSLTSRYFYPTPLSLGVVFLQNATASETSNANPLSALATKSKFTSSSNSVQSASKTSTLAISSGASDEGYLIVETNYRVYAYTSSPLHIHILSLFVELERRCPGLVIGRITRAKIRQALSLGITSNEIIGYMTLHAHPEMKANRDNNPSRNVIPEVIIDVIRIWEAERNRISTLEVTMFNSFPTIEAFKQVEQEAQRIGVLVSGIPSPTDPKLFVTRNGRDQIRKFIADHKL